MEFNQGLLYFYFDPQDEDGKIVTDHNKLSNRSIEILLCFNGELILHSLPEYRVQLQDFSSWIILTFLPHHSAWKVRWIE